MTDLEKAQEICEKHKRYNVECSSLECYMSALEMAEWKEQQMIEKAYEWMKDNAGDSYLDWYDWEKCMLNKDELLHDFREAMEE